MGLSCQRSVKPSLSTAAPATAQGRTFGAQPAVVHREGAAVLVLWDVPGARVFSEPKAPDDAGWAAYVKTHQMSADAMQRWMNGIRLKDDEKQAEFRERKSKNVSLMFRGEGGVIRPIHCLESLLFAYHHERHDQVKHPTGFLSAVLRKTDASGTRLKVYYGASDEMHPPKAVYGIEQAKADVAAGWTFWMLLHNHTPTGEGGRHAVGSPAPSRPDAQFFKILHAKYGLREAWITNGYFTGVIPAENFDKFEMP